MDGRDVYYRVPRCRFGHCFLSFAGFSAATVVFVAAAPLVTFAPDTMVEDNVPGVQENDGDLD